MQRILLRARALPSFLVTVTLSFATGCFNSSSVTKPVVNPPPGGQGGSSIPLVPGDVTTYHGDYSRDGQNLAETILTRQNVTPNSFGKLGALSVDGLVYAQPLTLSNVKGTDGQLHNVVYIATEHDSVYAYDMDTLQPFWNPNAGPNDVTPPGAHSLLNDNSSCTSVTCRTVTTGEVIKTVPVGSVTAPNISPEIGITATPVIDPVDGVIYVTAMTAEQPGNCSGPVYYWRVHALSLTDGTEVGTPITIGAESGAINGGNPSCPGGGCYGSTLTNPTANAPSSSGGTPASGTVCTPEAGGVTAYAQTTLVPNSANGTVTFDALRQLSRSGLVLNGGILYVAFSSFNDQEPAHGWVFGYEQTDSSGDLNPNPLGPWASTADKSGDGNIWMAGGAPAVDSSGNLFFATGNGDGSYFSNSSFIDMADSVIKLGTNGYGTGALGIASMTTDIFTPYDYQTLALKDVDLGAGGVLLLPDQAGPYPHELIAGGKEGTIYVLNRDNMGGQPTAGATADVIGSSLIQELPHQIAGNTNSSGIFGTPSYYQGNYFVIAIADTLRSVPVQNGKLNWDLMSYSSVPLGTNVLNGGTTSAKQGLRGATASISANGQSNGIIWYLDASAYSYQWVNDTPSPPQTLSFGPPVLYAYSTDNVTTPIYSTNMNVDRDAPGCPITANGIPGSGAGCAVKYAVPTVSHGKVFVGSDTEVTVYGLLPSSSGTTPTEVTLTNFANQNLPATYGSLVTKTGPNICALGLTTDSSNVTATLDGQPIPVVASAPCSVTMATPDPAQGSHAMLEEGTKTRDLASYGSRFHIENGENGRSTDFTDVLGKTPAPALLTSDGRVAAVYAITTKPVEQFYDQAGEVNDAEVAKLSDNAHGTLDASNGHQVLPSEVEIQAGANTFVALMATGIPASSLPQGHLTRDALVKNHLPTDVQIGSVRYPVLAIRAMGPIDGNQGVTSIVIGPLKTPEQWGGLSVKLLGLAPVLDASTQKPFPTPSALLLVKAKGDEG